MECPICFQCFEDDAYSTMCGHVYCKRCLDEAVKIKFSCPACSRPLTMNDTHRIFLPECFNKSQDGIFVSEMLATRVADLEIKTESNKVQASTAIAKTDELALNFSKIDSENATIMKETEQLKQEMNDIKMMLKNLKAGTVEDITKIFEIL